MTSEIRHNPSIEYVHDSEAVPEYSIVMPVHNQESILSNILRNIRIHTQGLYELILIFDGCTDNSRDAISGITIPSNMTRLVVITNSSGLFETSSDNQGFMLSRAEYIIEIQADMLIQTPGYNELLCKPMRVFNDLIAVSGRCCHQLNGGSYGVGKLGMDV